MKQAFFYILTEESPSLSDSVNAWAQSKELLVTQRDKLACWLASRYFQTRKRVLLSCENKEHAERIDEWLWRMDLDNFIPHNLAGEGPRLGAPIEICWPDRRTHLARDILINLGSSFPDFATVFKSVIDFVPVLETEKVLARARYKQFRDIGFQLKMIDLPERFITSTQ